MAQLEALALGAVLVCSATEGPFEALAIARELKPELVAADQTSDALSGSISFAFGLGDPEIAAYSVAASGKLAAYRPDVVANTIATQVLPALL